MSFVWTPSRSLPEVLNLDVGLLLTTYPGAVARPSIEKLLPPGTTIELGRRERGERLLVRRCGGTRSSTSIAPASISRTGARLAANTLLWERDGMTYRLESALDRAARYASRGVQRRLRS